MEEKTRDKTLCLFTYKFLAFIWKNIPENWDLQEGNRNKVYYCMHPSYKDITYKAENVRGFLCA